MPDYEIFNWLNAYMLCVERLKFGKFVLTYWDISGNERQQIGDTIKDCVRKACTIQ